jgi:hypothetical protein
VQGFLVDRRGDHSGHRMCDRIAAGCHDRGVGGMPGLGSRSATGRIPSQCHK